MDFGSDARAVTPIIAAVLLFALVILAFSGYQLTAVPSENQLVELEHNQQVQNEMVDVRNAVLEAKTSGRETYAQVTLGTRYPNRVFAINPPNPRGTVETTENRTITVEAVVESDFQEVELVEHDQETRFIEYEPRYREYENHGTLRYENTVLYHDFEDGNVPLTGQSLLRGDTVNLVPIEGEFHESGIQRASVEPIPGVVQTRELEHPTVTVPTELSEDDWETILADEIATNDQLDENDVTVSGGELQLRLTGTYTIRYTPVGVNEPPEIERGEQASDINPAAPGDIRLVDEYLQESSSSEIIARFENSADNTSIDRARINFYSDQDPGGQDKSRADIGELPPGVEGPPPSLTDPSGTLEFRDDYTTLDPAIELEGNGNVTEVLFNFYDGNETEDPNLSHESWFIFTMELTSGESGQYFIPIPGDSDAAPLVQTQDATDVGETEATLNGELASLGSADDATVYFEFRESGASSWVETSTESMSSTGSFDAHLSGLAPETEYEFRAVAEGDGGGTGVVKTFTTSPGEPEPTGPYFDVTVDGTNEPVEAGDQLIVEATIENAGDESDSQTVTLSDFDGTVVDSESVSLGPGDETTIALTWQTDESDIGTDDVTVSSDDDSDTEEVTILSDADEPFFEVTIDETNEPVTEGDTLEVETTVENVGGEADTQTVELEDFDGAVVDDESVTLEGEESTTITLLWETEPGDAGSDDVTVRSDDDSDTEQVTIEADLEDAYFDVAITDTNEPVTEGDTLEVETTIENVGGEADTQTVELEDFDGNVVDTESISLGPGDETTVTLTWETESGDAGSDDVTVRSEDDSDAVSATVHEIVIDLRVDDLTHAQEDQTEFITSVAVEHVTEDFDRIEVEHQSLDEAWAGDQSGIDASRGSVQYLEGGAVGHEYEITASVINADGTVAAERTVTTDADAVNPVEDDLARDTSPQFVSTTIDDRSTPGQEARYDLGYEVDGTAEFDSVTMALVSTTNGGADRQESTDTTDEVELNTYGYEEEFKFVHLLFDEDGVVVDANVETDTADGTDP